MRAKIIYRTISVPNLQTASLSSIFRHFVPKSNTLSGKVLLNAVISRHLRLAFVLELYGKSL